MAERATVQFAVNFLSDATAETLVAHIENDSCTWENDFGAFAQFLEAGWGRP